MSEEQALSPELVSTEEAGQRIDEGKGRIFPCDGCGADLHFHVGQQQLKCPYCSYERAIEIADEAGVREQDFRAMLERLATLRAEGQSDALGQDELNEVRCSACGSGVVFPGTLTSTECAFCGSPVQRGDVHRAEHRVPVDGVLPFQVDAKKAKANLAAWVKGLWFAPNDFKKRGAQGKFSGVYLPYWTFDSHTYTTYTGQRGEHYWVTVGSGKNRRRVRKTRWYPASGEFERFFDDVLVNATAGLPEKLLRELEPWPLHRVLPFNHQVMAGYFARTYDQPLDEGFVEGRKRIDAALYEEICRRIGGDTQRVHSQTSTYDPISYKHLLLPVWMLAYRYKDRVYRVVVNAGTGEVQGERPWSWVKITLLVLGILVVGGVIAAAVGLR